MYLPKDSNHQIYWSYLTLLFMIINVYRSNLPALCKERKISATKTVCIVQIFNHGKWTVKFDG